MAARISRSVKTACEKMRSVDPKLETLHQPSVQQVLTCIAANGFKIKIHEVFLPLEQAWKAARVWTALRQQHEYCYDMPRQHGNGLLRSSGML